MFQCFVICPFGSQTRGEEEKILFNQLRGLRKYVFRPTEAVCRRRGVPVKISDSREIDHGSTRIKDAVQRCIDAAAAVIVLLSADKPNVFIEFGWAQGMWQTPILLKSNRYNVPVDISNDLTLSFTDGDIDGSDKASARKLIASLADEIIKRIQRGRNSKQFEHWPETTLARGAVHVYNRFSRAIDLKEWHRIVNSAGRKIVIASTSMSRILGHSVVAEDESGAQRAVRLGELLLQKAIDGVRVTVLLYHRENLTNGHLKRSEKDLETAHSELSASLTSWFTLKQTFENLRLREMSREGDRSPIARGSFRVIQLRQRHLPFRVTLTETRVVLTLRLYTERYNSGLCIDALAPTGQIDAHNLPFYKQIEAELDFLIAENEQASEKTYQDWSQAQAA